MKNHQYHLFPEPNYSLTSKDSTRNILTDGQYTSGHFWSSKSTVGWQQNGLIRLDFDLQGIYLIQNIHFQTARGIKAGVSFPSRADVYISADAKIYKYVGNILESADLPDGPYLVKKFISPSLNETTRYVSIFISPKGNYTFLDEVEIWGKPGGKAESGFNIPVSKLRNFQSAIISNEHELEISSFLQQRLVQQQVSPSASSPALFPLKVEQIARDREQLFAANAQQIAANYPNRLICWSGSPWDIFTPVDNPGLDAFHSPSLSFQVLTNGTSCQSVNIVSTLDKVTKTDFAVIWDESPSVTAPEISVFDCLPVTTKSGILLCDPLLPVAGQLSLKPGVARQIILAAKGNVPPGTYSGSFQLIPDFVAPVITIPFKVHVFGASIHDGNLPYSNAWAYLSWRPVKDMPEKALEDLQKHHVNIGIIHPNQIPWPQKLTQSLSLQDVLKFDKALSLLKNKRHVLLFLHLRDEKNLEKFGDYADKPRWNANLKRWIVSMRDRFVKNGYEPERILFYPVDEPQNSQHVEMILNFAAVLKNIDSKLRTYTTIDRISRLSKSDFYSLAQACDVIQIEENDLLSEDARYVQSLGRELWVYGVSGEKTASPMQGYRLMAWRAFRRGATGIGFWAYADTGREGTAWNDIDGARPDYSVIYEGNNTIISSKRWEAWREGCEDYALLELAERNLSSEIEKAEFYRRLDRVISIPDDYKFFEETRLFLLEKASGVRP
ncbi:glycoside hydrolase domain-containing protein [Desulfomicrobium norvegicum]|uniref:glycoside hydrolase domain-containing protein n=1 Tax=Desulfomicrobium norvegicum (strain DSM 1741 / NCIMB 8310) TaxID=52561 RepID=UPI00137A12D5|nr:glycoside hydrolase domain-containing protein [Desulfomicrobium norvegicum]